MDNIIWLFFIFAIPGLVHRGDIRRCQPGYLRQPRLPEWTLLPHLWLRDPHRAGHPDAPARELGHTIPAVGLAHISFRTGYRVPDGKAFSPALVGLYRGTIQYRRIHMPALFAAMGGRLRADS